MGKGAIHWPNGSVKQVTRATIVVCFIPTLYVNEQISTLAGVAGYRFNQGVFQKTSPFQSQAQEQAFEELGWLCIVGGPQVAYVLPRLGRPVEQFGFKKVPFPLSE
jgi:hypothetical protein